MCEIPRENKIIKSKQETKIISNIRISDSVYELKFCSEQIAETAKAGQFVNVYLEGGEMLLPRPFGIANVEEDIITVVFAVVGAGTERLSNLLPGMSIKILGPNGTGFDIKELKKQVIIVGGGLGIPPLLFTAKQISESGKKGMTAVLGYRESPFYNEEIGLFCEKTYAVSEKHAEMNSLYSATGNVVDVLNMIEKEDSFVPDDTVILACGPKPMLKALADWVEKTDIFAQFSLEERMGCGYGACVGCVCTLRGANGKPERKKVCVDGPVFDGKLIIWD